jgi:outer membrane biosynthesis protein TonB
MRFAVGLVCVAACATKPAPAPTNAQRARTEAAAPANANVARTTRSQLTPDVVLATIRSRYLGGVERCYRRHLKQDASARGRVFVSFTVDPKGRARDGEARGITERVDGCIAAQVARWQFPKPAQEARFALGLQLGVN